MRFKGKLLKWDDEKAFGFIVPNGGGNHVFIHKKAFSNRQRTPKINDVITYSITKDNQGRYCADEATFLGEKRIRKQTKSISQFPIYLSVIFLALLVAAFLMHYIPNTLVLLYFACSIITLLAYRSDKTKASKQGASRTPESTLHLLALSGGWPGAAIAQQIFRHKSQKRAFRIVFWQTVIVNCALLAWLTSESAAPVLDLLTRYSL
ncbi:MAG: DUF1294 domain-containing protein [Cognaticolwellia sp.]